MYHSIEHMFELIDEPQSLLGKRQRGPSGWHGGCSVRDACQRGSPGEPTGRSRISNGPVAR